MPIQESLISLASSLYGLVARSHKDLASYQILSLVNGKSGEGADLEDALNAYVSQTLIPSFRGELAQIPPTSFSLYQSLGEWLRLRPDDCVDFECRELDLSTNSFPVYTRARFETCEEAQEDRNAFKVMLEMEKEGNLIFNEAHSEYHSEKRPDADLSESIKTSILLWPQMAALLLEDIIAWESDGLTKFRIKMDFDPEDGSPSLHCYPDFESQEQEDSYYRSLNEASSEDDVEGTFIHGPNYLNRISIRTASKRVRFIRNDRKRV